MFLASGEAVGDECMYVGVNHLGLEAPGSLPRQAERQTSGGRNGDAKGTGMFLRVRASSKRCGSWWQAPGAVGIGFSKVDFGASIVLFFPASPSAVGFSFGSNVRQRGGVRDRADAGSPERGGGSHADWTVHSVQRFPQKHDALYLAF